MSPLLMDTGYETISPSSMSAEENHSSNAGSERDGEGEQVGTRGAKRQEKNRNAARKSRKKQTERADDLHEELQNLERSNSAFQKEIASLKKDLHFYTTALERHQPHCTLKASKSSSTTHLSVPPSAEFPSPLSLFCETLPSLITSRMTKASTICTSLISSPVHSSSVTTPAQPKSRKRSIHASSSFSANACFSTKPPDASPMKQASFQSPSSDAVPTYSPFGLENTGQTSQGCPMNLSQLQQGNNNGNPVNPSPMYSLSPSAFQDPGLQFLSVSPNPTPLLSQLTVPSPLNAPQTTSISFEGLLSQTSLQTLVDYPVEDSLSELLNINEWILQ
ncbi:basic leucine zipper transcriptional factor ATF-like 2 isoform X3 [Notolabrus celidotus]|uniref:basic leucine zipper transcriptional factor ATF-like 2 isoform X3 n=1 Tax=Notolabrus celidotus TaxID=1203425 RepID=UPI001490156E|nr:basic leucine zipper transcriptional factor ATF-like 2 isoform X3 [Notolabrus celidotus]